jgi:hypothetical protein
MRPFSEVNEHLSTAISVVFLPRELVSQVLCRTAPLLLMPFTLRSQWFV